MWESQKLNLKSVEDLSFSRSPTACRVQLDPGTTERFLGATVAVYSFTQLVASPLVGWWSNRREQIREPVVCCLLLSLFSNLLYFAAQAAELSHHRRYVVFAARAFMGLGASECSRNIRFKINVSSKMSFHLSYVLYHNIVNSCLICRISLCTHDIFLHNPITSNIPSGVISLLRSYAAMASTSADRARAISLVTGGFALGMTTGPGE